MIPTEDASTCYDTTAVVLNDNFSKIDERKKNQ